MQKLKFPNLLIQCFSPEHASAIIAEAEKFGYIPECYPHRGEDVSVVRLQSDGTYYLYTFLDLDCLLSDFSSEFVEYKVCTAKAIRNHVEKLRTVESTDRLSTLTVKPKSDVEVAEVVEAEPKLSLWSKLVVLFTFVFNYLRGKK